MDSKNVIAAISLSAAVIILYSLFFQPDPEVIKKNLTEKTWRQNSKPLTPSPTASGCLQLNNLNNANTITNTLLPQ